MRMSSGKLTRRLPRVEVTAADVKLRYLDDGTGRAEFHYVAPAEDPATWAEPFVRLGRAHETSRAARWEAWQIAAQRGGRLLDQQRGALVEQPLWWDFRIDLAGEDPADFQRKKKGEQRLKRALVAWIGLPSLDAIKLARMLASKWEARFALTQTEILKMHQGLDGLTPLSKALAVKITHTAGELMPSHLEKPYRPSLSAPVVDDVRTGNPYTIAA